MSEYEIGGPEREQASESGWRGAASEEPVVNE
jgi:hypothetical protein